jgi:hypothetical protein
MSVHAVCATCADERPLMSAAVCLSSPIDAATLSRCLPFLRRFSLPTLRRKRSACAALRSRGKRRRVAALTPPCRLR